MLPKTQVSHGLVLLTLCLPADSKWSLAALPLDPLNKTTLYQLKTILMTLGGGADRVGLAMLIQKKEINLIFTKDKKILMG